MKRLLALLPRHLTLLGALAGAVLLGAAGCAGDLDPTLYNNTGAAGTGGAPPPCDAPGMLFAMTMTCGACHYPGSALGGGLDLASSGVVGRLANNGPSTDSTAMCQSAGQPYLMMGSNPAAGLLIDKVTKATPQCGAAMPIGLPLTAQQKSCLMSWATAVTTGAITQ